MINSNIKTYWPYVLILILSIATFQALLHPGYFSHQDDLQVMRIFEMRKCLADLQIPCRWVPDMGFGNGYPLFNYYGVPPYYLGAFLSFMFGYIGAAKIIFIIPLALGGFMMFILGKEFFGKIAGLASAVLFIFAPYRAVDIYVRGDVTESLALSLAPLLFYLFVKLIKEDSLIYLVSSSLVLGIFLMIHNVISLYFIPVLFVWIFYWLWREGFRNLKMVFISLGLGIAFSATFLLPAFFEKDLVQVESLKKLMFDFRAHFVTISQLFFSRFWGYGPSLWGSDDGLSFQIGWPHWWLVLISIPVTIVLYFKKKHSDFISLSSFYLALFFLSAFMTHNKSAFIWEKIELIQFSQFPWRFLSLVVFSASILGGGVISILNKRYQYLALVIILFLTISLNLPYFKVDRYFQISDQEKLSGYEFEKQQYAGILDYLPKTAIEPNEPAPDNPIVISGEAEIENFNKRSNRFSFETRVSKEANIEIPVFDFPVWKIKVNGRLVTHSNKNYLGRIRLDLPQGNYRVEGFFADTSIRSIANLLTIFSAVSLLVLIALPRICKIKRK